MSSNRRQKAPPRPAAPGANALAAAARIVMAVAHEGRSADAVLAELPQGPERSAIRAIALGTLRWYLRLAPAVAPLLSRPVGEMSPVLHALLVAGAHQIVYSRGAPEVSVHLAVDAARVLRQPQATGMVNAVLRRFVVERERLLAEADRKPAARHAVPRWFYERLIADWDEATALEVLAASSLHPPMTLRVDLSRVSRVDYLQQLAAANIEAHAVDWCDGAVMLQQPTAVASLPGFTEGLVSVQDAGAQLAGPLMELAPGQRVLDACAAPGGKSGQMLELTNGQIALTAIDIDAARLAMMRENFRRLGRDATCVQADLSKTLPPEADWAQPDSYDRILLDAPCTATGVLRRHPDIRLLRRPSDAAAFVAIQTRLLQQCFSLLRPGGRLIYATCSILQQENDGVITAFLANEPAAALSPFRASGLPANHRMLQCGIALLPGNQAETDGFYYAGLTKVAKAQHS